MIVKVENILENKWYQELGVLLFAFTLFTVKNDWIIFHSFPVVLAAVCYFFTLYFHAQCNRFFLLPILFRQHKPVLYLVLTVVLAFLFSIFLHKIMSSWISRSSDLYKFSHQKGYPYQLASVVGTLICVLGPTAFLNFYSNQKKQSDEALLFNQMQLNSLRSQLNPHFLFNTFNTLYGISLEYPERTPDLIMKVSQLMRYQLESNSKACVPIDEELSFINSYIQLEKERISHRCDVTYESKVDNENTYKISPMLLIVFIENAFKHGTCTIENCYVHISIKVKEGHLHLNITNSIPDVTKDVISTKIGLKNTKERLQLIYGDDFTLDIRETGKTFLVDLTIKLKKLAP